MKVICINNIWLIKKWDVLFTEGSLVSGWKDNMFFEWEKLPEYFQLSLSRIEKVKQFFNK